MQEIVEQNKFNLLTSEWFKALIDDCKTFLIERRYRIAAELLEMKWEIGGRILQDTVKFEKLGISGGKICHLVSQALNCSKREIERCVQFRKKYPDLTRLPEGKNITWHKIVNQYLPEKSKSDDPEEECQHKIVEILIRCAKCRERLAFRKQGINSSIDIAKLLDSKKRTGEEDVLVDI